MPALRAARPDDLPVAHCVLAGSTLRVGNPPERALTALGRRARERHGEFCAYRCGVRLRGAANRRLPPGDRRALRSSIEAARRAGGLAVTRDRPRLRGGACRASRKTGSDGCNSQEHDENQSWDSCAPSGARAEHFHARSILNSLLTNENGGWRAPLTPAPAPRRTCWRLRRRPESASRAARVGRYR